MRVQLEFLATAKEKWGWVKGAAPTWRDETLLLLLHLPPLPAGRVPGHVNDQVGHQGMIKMRVLEARGMLL